MAMLSFKIFLTAVLGLIFAVVPTNNKIELKIQEIVCVTSVIAIFYSALSIIWLM